MMPRHPLIAIPDVGPMDHAWDLLGDWQAVLAPADRPDEWPVRLQVPSWEAIALERTAADGPDGHAASLLLLERISRIRRVPDGGGALAWACAAEDAPEVWAVTAWPGELRLACHGGTGNDRVTAVVRAVRAPAYYRRKYPAPP